MSDSLPRALRAVILVAVSSLGVPIGCGTTKTVQLRELSNDALKATVSRQERTESFVKEVGGGGGRGAIPIPSCNGCNACASRLSPEISYVLTLRGARNTKITLACEPTQLRLQAEGRAVAYACAENSAPSPASRTDAWAENSAPSPASRTDASGSTWHRLRFAKNAPFEDVDPEHAADAPLESLPPLSTRALALSGDTGTATSSPETLELLLGEVERQEGVAGTATVLAALLGSPATKYSVQFGNDDTYARRREDRAVAAVRGAFLAIAKEERAAATVTQAARTALTNANGDPVVLRWALGIVSPRGPSNADDRKALAAALPALGARLRKAGPEDKGLTRDWLARQVQFDPAQAATVACAEMSEKAPFLTKESIALALAAGGVEETARRGAGACGHAVADTFFPPEVVCKANATEPRTDAELREVLTTWRASSDVEPPLPYPELAYLAGVENGLAPMLARRFARQTYAPPEDPAVPARSRPPANLLGAASRETAGPLPQLPACGNSLENGVACACLPTALQLCVADPKTTEIVGDHCVIAADDAGKRLHHPRNVCAKTGEACAGYDRCCGYAACTGGICGPRSVPKDAGASTAQDGAP